jgi:hypothetical protein
MVDRLTITSIGIGKAISIRSVMIFSTPETLSIELTRISKWGHTEDDQLELRLATNSWVLREYEPVVRERIALSEGHNLDRDIGHCEYPNIGDHRDFLPTKLGK